MQEGGRARVDRSKKRKRKSKKFLVYFPPYAIINLCTAAPAVLNVPGLLFYNLKAGVFFLSSFLLFFKRLGRAIANAFGADRINPEFKKFTLMHEVYILATVVTPTFVNTVVMRVPGTEDIALYYNFVHYIFIALSMLIAAKLLHHVTRKTVILIGVALSMVVYVIVLTCMDSVDSVYAVVAAVHGIATGLYWITYSDALLQYSTDDTRDICINFVGIFSGMISLFLPLLSGYLLDLFTDLTGYYILFGACGAMALLAVWLVTRLESEEIDHKKTQFMLVMKKVYTEKMWFFAIHMDFFRGIRDGAFSFFLNVLLFSIVSSEALVGVNTFLAGAVSMIASGIAGRIARPHNRMRLMTAAVALLLGVTALLFWQLNPFTVLLLSAASSFVGVFINNPVTTTLYTVFDHFPDSLAYKREVLSVSECYKDLGRISGIALIMLMPSGVIWSIVSLCILVSLQFVTVLFARLTLRTVRKNCPGQ